MARTKKKAIGKHKTLPKSKRFRKGDILHVKCGIQDVWDPSDEELDEIAELFALAEEDPVGAVVATRTGIEVEILRRR